MPKKQLPQRKPPPTTLLRKSDSTQPTAPLAMRFRRISKRKALTITGLVVTFDAASSTVNIFGVAADQATKEKALLCCGNVAGVSNVNDNMSVDLSEPEATYHDVVKGDTLWAIAKKVYGDGNKYPVIFEANKPMLSHPDKIYPGQKLRCPAL